MSAVSVRDATDTDRERIWEIFRAVVATGDTWTFAPDSSREDCEKTWFAPGVRPYVACGDDGRVVGMYFLRPNQPGLGAHVGNAGYMVDPRAQARGIGTALGEHSLAEARRLGFRALQFNFVVSTNERAVALWKRLGFSIIGTSPGAFRHAKLGYVDAYLMHQTLI